MFQTKVVEKIKIHILCSVTFFAKRALYGVEVKQSRYKPGVAQRVPGS
jgi:hypothetical protein